jgi:hypothetical protein
MTNAAALFVIAGLDPAIQPHLVRSKRHVDVRVEPGHGE